MAKKPFSKSFGFFHSFSTNFLVLYMVTGATPPDSWGHCTSLLYCLAINEGNIFILHCGSHPVTLYAISTLLSPSLSL